MIKRYLLVAGLLLLTLVLAEVVSLLQLRSSLQSYAEYWQTRPASGEITYVALGDSAAQGIGASRPNKGYVGLFAKQLAESTGKSVRIVNLSVSGAKLADVIAHQLPELSRYQPNVITIEAGANDMVNFNEQSFQTEFTDLANQLPAGTIVANMPNFGGRLRRPEQIATANKIIATIVAQHDFRNADLYTAIKSHESPFNYAADFFHPNNLGYKNWVAAFWKAYQDSSK